MLLGALVGEHFVRSPLLIELADEFAATPGLDDAVSAVLALVAGADGMANEVFDARVRALGELVRARL